MKKILLILFLIPILSKAQQTNVDSLINVLNTQKLTSNEQLDLYEKICQGYYASHNPEMNTAYANKGLVLAEKEKNNLKKSRFNEYIGYAYSNKEEYDTALIYYEKALDIAVKANEKEQEVGMYITISALHGNQGNYTTSLEYSLKALPFCESLEDKNKQTRVLFNIGALYGALNNQEKALEYLNQAKELAEKYDNKAQKMSVYYELAKIHKEKGEYDKALILTQESLEISRSLKNQVREAINLQFLAQIYYNKEPKEYELSLKNAKESAILAEKIGYKLILIGSWNILSNVYRETRKFKESNEFASKAWGLDSVNLSTNINSVGENVLYNLALTNFYLDKFQEAEWFLGKYHHTMRNYSDKSLHESLSEMEVKYETEKKEMRIATLEKERTLYIGLSIAVLVALLSAIGLLFYRHRSTSQQRQIAQEKVIQMEQAQELIAKNAALKAEEAERDLIARDLHDSIGTLLTVVKSNMMLYSNSGYEKTDYFNKAFDVLGKSITDLRRVIYHIKSCILTDEGLVAAVEEFCRSTSIAKFHLSGLNRRFNRDKEYILFNCTCELINNALRHSEASQIDVYLNIDEEMVYLSVVDNGCGFNPQTITPGIGIENIRSNLSVFDGRLDIYSEPDKGTEMNVELEAKE